MDAQSALDFVTDAAGSPVVAACVAAVIVLGAVALYLHRRAIR